MAGGRIYQMILKLNAKLGEGYKGAFANAENIASQTVNKIGKTVAKVGGLVLGGVGISNVVDTYKEFQQSMANTGAIAGVAKTSAEYRALENAAREAGKATTKTAKESADALGYMALAGWKTEDCLKGLMPILKLSEATGADLARTSDLVTDSMAAMGYGVDELSNYLDIAANANNKANLTATQLLETYIKAGGMLKAMGATKEESAAIASVLANRGKKDTEAGTALNSILVNLTGNGRSSGEALDKLGISAYNSSGKFKGIVNILKEVAKAMATASDETKHFISAKLGGKTQMDTFYALLGGVNTIEENGKSELENYIEEYKHSDGMLNVMQEAMNDTLSGTLKILESASDEVKIQFMKEIEPTVTPIIRKIADKLPEMGEKFAAFMKNVVRKAKELWKTVSPVFEFAVNNFDKIKAGIMGVGAAFVTAKIANKIKNIGVAFKALMNLMKAHPILLLVEAIVAVGVAIHELWEQTKEANLAAHFGKITLSAEEMDNVVGKIVKNKNFEKMQKSLSLFDDLGETEKKIQENLKEIEKTNWKISVGLDLTVDERGTYAESINNYVDNCYKYLEDAFLADYSLFDGDIVTQKAISAYYYEQRGELKEIGEKMKDAIAEGIKDGVITLDEANTIKQLQESAEKVRSELAKSEYNSAMIAIELETKEKMKLNGGKLTAENYKELMKKAQEANEKYNSEERLFFAKKIEGYERAYGKGTDTYNTKRAEAEKNLQDNIQERESNIWKFGYDTINSTYGTEISNATTKYTAAIDGMSGLLGGKLEQQNKSGKVYSFRQTNLTSFDSFRQMIIDHFGMDKASLENIKNLYKEIEPYEASMKETKKNLEEKIKKFSKEGKEVPENIKSNYNEIITYLNNLETLRLFTLDGIQAQNEAWEKVGANLPKNPQNTNELNNLYNYNLKNPTSGDSFLYNVVNGYQKSANKQSAQMDIDLILTPNINLNKEKAKQSTNENRNNIKNEMEKTLNVDIKADATVSAGAIDTTNFEASVTAAMVTSAANAVEISAKEAVAKTESKDLIKTAIKNINGHAKGTDYTEDTFIAGEAGAELITGAKGRKVFNALETGNIIANIGRIKDMLYSAVGTASIFNKMGRYENIFSSDDESTSMRADRIVNPTSNVDNSSSNVTLTINNEIKIDGAATKNSADLKSMINQALEENSEKLIELIQEVIDNKEQRRIRLSNG